MKLQSDESGFSLVELLIALSILSLVIVTVASTFGFAQHVFQLMSDDTYQLDHVTLTRRLLLDALSQLDREAMPDQPRFVGDRNGFSVFALAPRILGSAGPLLLKVEVLSRGGLTIAWPMGADSTNDTRNDTRFVDRTLAADYHVSPSYYSAPTGWSAAWQRNGYEPSLVRFGFTPTGGDDSELGFIIPVRDVRPAQCAIRPSVKGCEPE